MFQSGSTQIIDFGGGAEGSSETFKNFNKARFIDFQNNITDLDATQLANGHVFTVSATEAEFNAMSSIRGHYFTNIFSIDNLFACMLLYNDDSVPGDTDEFNLNQGVLNVRSSMNFGDGVESEHPIGAQTTLLNKVKTVSDLNTFQKMVDLNTSDVDKYSDRSQALELQRNNFGAEFITLNRDDGTGVSFPPKSIMFCYESPQDPNPLDFPSTFGWVMYLGAIGTHNHDAATYEMDIYINQKNHSPKGRCGYFDGRRFRL